MEGLFMDISVPGLMIIRSGENSKRLRSKFKGLENRYG